MQLPDDDARYLTEKEFNWRLEPDGAGAFLILEAYPLDTGRYDRDSTDIMLRIPAGYPLAALDMFYADPWVKLSSGSYPPQADVAFDACGRHWQRFSRHLNQPWRAGLDGVPGFLAIVSGELQRVR
jgi:hypothetical protein